MLRVLVEFGVPLVLFVFALVDCIQTDESLVRNLPKAAWILLIVLVPLVGSIAWLAAGRPTADQRGQGRRQVAWPATATAGFPEYERPGYERPGYERRGRPVAPDDDPEFLRTLGAEQRRHEQMLGDWEQDLRRREAALRESEGSDSEPPAPDADPREPETP
ncbi:MAG TPA: PLD nuclease N-terminal domain-containing protein [Motilibacteraceae bacterium]|nr:PLD nuclease N-terminal domain-containing protein [Motilibacteraceae bacterium]